MYLYVYLQVVLLGKYNAQGLGQDYELLLRYTKGTVCLYSVSVQRVYMCTSVTCGLMCTARTLSVR